LDVAREGGEVKVKNKENRKTLCMRKIIFSCIIIFVVNFVYPQHRLPGVINANITCNIFDSLAKKDSLIAISILKIVNKDIDTILISTTAYLEKYSFRCINMSFFDCINDSSAMLKIVGNVPNEWIGYSTNLIGCVKENGYLIFIYGNCNLDFKAVFCKTDEILLLNKNARIKDIVINTPTWFYTYSNKRASLLQGP